MHFGHMGEKIIKYRPIRTYIRFGDEPYVREISETEKFMTNATFFSLKKYVKRLAAVPYRQ